MRTENNGGDVLARGMHRAQFRAAGANVSQAKWDKIWEEPDESERSGSTNVEETGNAGTKSGEVAGS